MIFRQSKQPCQDYPTFKLILIGQAAVGKSALVSRYKHKSFNYEYICTIGVDYWDTAGQERFRALAISYYRHANGVFLVFDVTNMESFQDLQEKWIPDTDRYYSERPGVVRFLIANKVDRVDKRCVSTEDGQSLANALGFQYLETSALDGTNVDEMFQKMAEHIHSAGAYCLEAPARRIMVGLGGGPSFDDPPCNDGTQSCCS